MTPKKLWEPSARAVEEALVTQFARQVIRKHRLDANSYDAFYRSGNLDVVSGGNVVLKLTGVPEPESFRHAIVNAVKAWVPGKLAGPFQPASAVGKTA